MKYFVISDIHSHYDAMITALNKNGYDANNDNHHLLVLGDMFDRGKDAVKVLNYLYHLSTLNKATLILGNHDSFLLDFLNHEHSRVSFNIKYNGFGETLKALSGIEPDESNFERIVTIIDNRFPFLCDWLNELPYYIEKGDYIFVHGGIDGAKLDWRTMSSRRDFVWSRQHELTPIPGKTIVAGHHRVATIRVKTKDYHLLFLHNPETFDILYKEGMILIDRYVEVSNEINVLILDI